MRIAIVVGNRPHFIKCAPLLKALEKYPDIMVDIIHSGQHYDVQLSGAFLEDFRFPPVTENLAVGSGSIGVQTGTILARLDPVFRRLKPDRVVCMGDTNTTLAAALAAFQLHIPNAHIEAGMRENIWRPEEINKKMADHCGDYLFAPIPRAMENLRKEGIEPERIFLTGDITLDTFTINRKAAEAHFSALSRRLRLPRRYHLMTLHRAETVDDPDILGEVLEALAEWRAPIVFPVHPRTEKRISEYGLEGFWDTPGVVRLPPARYLDFLALLLHADAVLTDSSGVLKEAFYARKKCLVLDDTSEYREIFDLGAAIMGGRTKTSLRDAITHLEALPAPDIHENPFGDGSAALRMVEVLRERPPFF